jgi:hypothetical protein
LLLPCYRLAIALRLPCLAMTVRSVAQQQIIGKIQWASVRCGCRSSGVQPGPPDPWWWLADCPSTLLYQNATEELTHRGLQMPTETHRCLQMPTEAYRGPLKPTEAHRCPQKHPDAHRPNKGTKVVFFPFWSRKPPGPLAYNCSFCIFAIEATAP